MNFEYSKKGNFWFLGAENETIFIKIKEDNKRWNGKIYINGEVVKDIFEEDSKMVCKTLKNELFGIYDDIGDFIK